MYDQNCYAPDPPPWIYFACWELCASSLCGQVMASLELAVTEIAINTLSLRHRQEALYRCLKTVAAPHRRPMNQPPILALDAELPGKPIPQL